MDLDQREAVYVHEVTFEAVKQMDVGERGKQKTRLCFNSNTKVIQISRIILSLTAFTQPFRKQYPKKIFADLKHLVVCHKNQIYLMLDYVLLIIL